MYMNLLIKMSTDELTMINLADGLWEKWRKAGKSGRKAWVYGRFTGIPRSRGVSKILDSAIFCSFQCHRSVLVSAKD
jgi:hypothetical protein